MEAQVKLIPEPSAVDPAKYALIDLPSDRQIQDAQVRAMLVGQSRAFRDSIKDIQTIAYSDKSVLIQGETGTGKEVVARAIHYLSARAGGPFVPVNCGAIPESLLEDELFGHERGAFTGAQNRRCGLLAEAEHGTLLLDEIDALSPRAQVALLRFLQDRRYRPVGASGDRRADVRVLAATNAPIDPQTSYGRFRADLFFRICVFRIHLPPLRGRRDDILPLARHFLREHGTSRYTFTPRACAALLAFDWPGNVRELENAVLRACHLSTGVEIDAEHLGLSAAVPSTADGISAVEPMGLAKHKMIVEFEKQYLIDLMSSHQGNVTKAASTAGKDRRELGKLLKKHGIDPRQFCSKLV